MEKIVINTNKIRKQKFIHIKEFINKLYFNFKIHLDFLKFCDFVKDFSKFVFVFFNYNEITFSYIISYNNFIIELNTDFFK